MAELALLHWQSSARSPQIAPLAETKLDVVWHLLRAWRDLWWPDARGLTGNSWVLPAGPKLYNLSLQPLAEVTSTHTQVTRPYKHQDVVGVQR